MVAVSILAEKKNFFSLSLSLSLTLSFSLRVCTRVYYFSSIFSRMYNDIWMTCMNECTLNHERSTRILRVCFLCSLLYVLYLESSLLSYAKSLRRRELFRRPCLRARAPNKRWQSKLCHAVKTTRTTSLSRRSSLPSSQHSLSLSLSLFLIFPMCIFATWITFDNVSVERDVPRKGRVVLASIRCHSGRSRHRFV